MSLPRDFKGIWIPKELWLDDRLTYLEKAIFAEIDSLDGPDHCYADNEHFERMFNAKERTVSQVITKLKRLNLIEQIKFDGRTRWLKSNLKTSYTFFYGSDQQKSASPPLRESIEPEIPKKIPKEKKVYKEKLPRKARQPAATPITLNKETKKFEGIEDDDIKRWQEAFPAVNIRKEIVECQLWALSVDRKNYRKSLNKWMSNVNNSNTTPYVKKEQVTEGTAEDRELNKIKSVKLERDFSGKGGIHYAILATSQKITFVMPNDEGYSVDYNNTREEFEKRCQKALQKMKIK